MKNDVALQYICICSYSGSSQKLYSKLLTIIAAVLETKEYRSVLEDD